jgi:hypothetical protein
MRARSQGTGSFREKIAEISGVIGGKQISGRCFAVTIDGQRTRHEVEVESGDERAVADVPRGAAPEPWLWRAMELFADTLVFRK